MTNILFAINDSQIETIVGCAWGCLVLIGFLWFIGTIEKDN